MNNTKNKTIKQEPTIQKQMTRQGNATKKQGQTANMLHGQMKYHDQERIETRMTD